MLEYRILLQVDDALDSLDDHLKIEIESRHYNVSYCPFYRDGIINLLSTYVYALTIVEVGNNRMKEIIFYISYSTYTIF